MERSPVDHEVRFPPATVEDYNEMGKQVPAEEIAAAEAEARAFQPPKD
jgi:hypothetical protein